MDGGLDDYGKRHWVINKTWKVGRDLDREERSGGRIDLENGGR